MILQFVQQSLEVFGSCIGDRYQYWTISDRQPSRLIEELYSQRPCIARDLLDILLFPGSVCSIGSLPLARWWEDGGHFVSLP